MRGQKKFEGSPKKFEGSPKSWRGHQKVGGVTFGGGQKGGVTFGGSFFDRGGLGGVGGGSGGVQRGPIEGGSKIIENHQNR